MYSIHSHIIITPAGYQPKLISSLTSKANTHWVDKTPICLLACPLPEKETGSSFSHLKEKRFISLNIQQAQEEYLRGCMSRKLNKSVLFFMVDKSENRVRAHPPQL